MLSVRTACQRILKSQRARLGAETNWKKLTDTQVSGHVVTAALGKKLVFGKREEE